MEEIRLKAGNEELKVKGSPETIQKQIEAFYRHQKELEEVNAKAKMDFMENMKEKMAVYAKQVSNTTTGIKRSTGKMEASWDEIQKAIRSGEKFCVGDYKTETLINGQAVTLVVTDVADDYVRFESRDCVGDKVCWNEDDTNTKGGFHDSDVKKYLDETIWHLLPEELKAVIGVAQKKWLDKDGNKAEYVCKLFLPAASEVFYEDECYGDEGLYEQLEYYKERRNRMRGTEEGEDTCQWWLASVEFGNSTEACYVDSRGNACVWNVYGGYRVPLCFLIKK